MKSISKRFLTIFVVLLFCLMALGSGDSKKEETINTNSNEETIDLDESTTDTSKQSDNLIPTIEETVLFEYNGIKVTAKEITEDWLGPELKVLIENDTDENINVSLDEIAVNDYMVSAWLYEDVAAGKKSNATFEIWSSTLSNAGISNIGKIDFYFRVINSDNYNTIYESKEIELKTSLYDEMDSEANDVGTELLNQNGIRIVGKGVNDSLWGQGVLLYIENNSDKNIIVSTDNLSVNGYMVNGYLYSTVMSNKKAIETVILSSTDLEDNDIESIEDLALSFDIINADTWMNIFSSDEITVNIDTSIE